MTDDAARAAFETLLAQPLLTASRHPHEHAAVLRHRSAVTDLAQRFGYRLRSFGSAVRLERSPLAGTVEHPPQPVGVPARRVLVLACLVAAACEDSDGAVTLAQLSSGVAAMTSSGSAAAVYDPDVAAHRRQLVRAVDLLGEHGVLTLRSGREALEAWQDSQAGPGAGYQVNRDALMLLTTVPDALASGDGDREATRVRRLRRVLVETPALVYADLADVDPADAAAARGMRGLLKGPVGSAVRGQVEDRAEGLVLLVGDPASPSPVAVDFPAARADSWAALLALDVAGQVGRRDADTGRVFVDEAQVAALLGELIADRSEYLRADLRDPAAVRSAVERQLVALALIQVTADGWVVSPVAGRYRAPQVRESTSGAVQEELA